MKIIDQTPFFNHETGAISLVDRGKAMMKYGAAWLNEVEAQKAILSTLENVLDRNFTLLRNITPPGLDIIIPFVLVGPTGVYVIYVTHLIGEYRAKGDQWGTISGSSFKPVKPNLLTRTDMMARAVQVFLQRNKYADLAIVEAVLLCADPSAHVDSLRPIVRVVMRDALERFAVSVSQAHVALSPEAVHDIAARLSAQPKPVAAQSAGAGAAAAAGAFALSENPDQGDETHIPAFTVPDSRTQAGEAGTWNAAGIDRMGFNFGQEAPAATQQVGPFVQPEATQPSAAQPSASAQENPFPFPDNGSTGQPQTRRTGGLTRNQIILLAGFGAVELILLAVFAYIVLTTFF